MCTCSSYSPVLLAVLVLALLDEYGCMDAGRGPTPAVLSSAVFSLWFPPTKNGAARERANGADVHCSLLEATTRQTMSLGASRAADFQRCFAEFGLLTVCSFRKQWLGVLRGGSESGHIEESGGQMSDNSQDKASEEQEPSCSEALQRMSELVEGAREGRSGLDDGYALLLDLEEQGLPVNTAVFNQFLRIAVELAKGGHASTVDGERIVERLEHEGLPLDEDTYLQMMLLIAEAAKHIDPEPKGYLSEGYGWLERMYASELAGDLNITEPVVNAYVDIYHTQNKWGVYELDPYEYNWCVDDESEDALWQAHPDIGVEAHIKERYTEEELEEMDEAERRLLGDTADGLVASDDVSGASGHADSSDSGSDFPEPTSSSL